MMENNTKCFVYIWDKPVGEMILVRDIVYFKYDSNFTLEISPLTLPISKSQYSFEKLNFQYSIAGVFADSLPDSFGMKILDSYFDRNYKKFTPNIIDKLLFIGDVSLGALSYRPAIESIRSKNIPINLKDAKKHKKNILSKHSYSSIRTAIDMYKSFSPAGGAKQKMIISYNKKDNSFYIGKTKKKDVSLIVKIDESDKPNYGVDGITEYIYSIVAKKCGINIPKTYLFKDEDDYSHFAIERFDIDKNQERLHTHTLAGLLHMNKSKRIDYIDVINTAKQYLYLPQSDIEELFRRMVFNYIYNNCDDHLKNYSFLMGKEGKWRLSPAYDLTYNNTVGQRVMMLNINGKISDEIDYNDFKEIAKKFKITNYKDIINKVEDSTVLFRKMLEEMMEGQQFKFDKLLLLRIQKIK